MLKRWSATHSVQVKVPQLCILLQGLDSEERQENLVQHKIAHLCRRRRRKLDGGPEALDDAVDHGRDGVEGHIQLASVLGSAVARGLR